MNPVFPQNSKIESSLNNYNNKKIIKTKTLIGTKFFTFVEIFIDRKFLS